MPIIPTSLAVVPAPYCLRGAEQSHAHQINWPIHVRKHSVKLHTENSDSTAEHWGGERGVEAVRDLEDKMRGRAVVVGISAVGLAR